MATGIRRAGFDAEVIEAGGRVGGGALPLLVLHGPVCAVEPSPRGAAELSAALRRAGVIGRVSDGRVLLDPRTMSDADSERAAEQVARALSAAQ